jgi:hypothetical protein
LYKEEGEIVKSGKINNKHKNIFESDTNIKQLIENYRYCESINNEENKILKDKKSLENKNDLNNLNILEIKKENESINRNVKVANLKDSEKVKYKSINERFSNYKNKFKIIISKQKKNIEKTFNKLFSNNKII